ncbi:uncharacterized protein LOC105261353 isoform X2 [Felis catus]|uniref:uncharacterized protein LOC105261353 isoform X2 n=1 Tax=Felis catus TaxID=9685 RepID=UPI00094853FA|nr:uncharacterized protein LOC105261353 isoform X2 [Felis catus]
MRVAGRNNSFPRPFFLPQGERREKERARRAEFLNGRTDATSPSPGRTPAPREAGSRERGSRAGGRGRRAASPPPRSRGWASGSSGLGPVSPSSWATTLAFRLLTWGGWVLVTLPPAFLHSWARAASSTTDSSRAIPREWKSHAQGHSAGWWKCQEAASSSPARPCPLCLMCPVGTSLPDSRRTTEGGFGCRLWIRQAGQETLASLPC